MTKPELTPLEQARQNVADRTSFGANKRAILAGDWDSGSLVREERIRIEEERREQQ